MLNGAVSRLGAKEAAQAGAGGIRGWLGSGYLTAVVAPRATGRQTRFRVLLKGDGAEAGVMSKKLSRTKIDRS
jgi:hypothetical protein